ncbi:related to RFA2-DNA replication factor A, 36 kDa subunit [Serendipita indica DSM 11827]|uniref:Related to RFA2-DNA replication factor A, 36 kDa subunit n=1 Tax=Serendipita indica (strain DSM 11827) TaxID=1109443 RepID=G4TU63_SERID|nr:related to RFA2-DNA replication factor A, 36 kDa subunit [Serendipita indica DSM 11827]
MSFGSQGPYYSGGGGGFLSNNSPGGYASQGSPHGAGTERKQTQSLRPLSIRQVLLAEQGSHTETDYTLDGVTLSMISIVGQIINHTSQTTSDVYKINDGSAEIEARHWNDSKGTDSMDMESDESPLLNKFVKITGTIRTFQERRHINAIIVRALDDPMEAYFHYTEAIAMAMLAKFGPPNGSGSSLGAPMTGGASASDYSRQGTSRQTNEVDSMYAHLAVLDRGIIRFIKDNPPTSEGYHVRQIIKAVKPLVNEETSKTGEDPADAFAAAIQRLIEEGLLFSTLDEHHYNLC